MVKSCLASAWAASEREMDVVSERGREGSCRMAGARVLSRLTSSFWQGLYRGRERVRMHGEGTLPLLHPQLGRGRPGESL